MRSVAATFFFLFLFCSAYAQKQTYTAAEKAALDSMFNEDEFINMLKTALNPKSYVLVSAGAGNGYFSTRNKQLNASQFENRLVLTPSLGYIHKSGISVSGTAYLASFTSRLNFYQFSLTPSYKLSKSKTISATLSYTHEFVRKVYQSVASPVQNEIYGSIYLKKPYLQPGISLGLSGGKYTDYFTIDTVLNGTRRLFTDTSNTKLRVFSTNIFVQHEFDFYNLLGKKDGLSVLPQLILNAGSQKINIVHKNLVISRLTARNSTRFKNLGVRNSKSAFEVQSLAFNLDFNYLVGKFGFESQVYFDYYLPETSSQRFTNIYSFVVSYAF